MHQLIGHLSHYLKVSQCCLHAPTTTTTTTVSLRIRVPRRPPRNLLTNTTPGILHFNGPSHEALGMGFQWICGFFGNFLLELIWDSHPCEQTIHPKSWRVFASQAKTQKSFIILFFYEGAVLVCCRCSLKSHMLSGADAGNFYSTSRKAYTIIEHRNQRLNCRPWDAKKKSV